MLDYKCFEVLVGGKNEKPITGGLQFGLSPNNMQMVLDVP